MIRKRQGGARMKTLYVDVYFLINMTVDILALHFSSLFFHLPIRTWRLTLAGVAGALFATAAVLCSENPWLVTALTLFGFFSMLLLAISGTGTLRSFRFAIGFLVLEILIGGLVYFFYGLLEKWIEKSDFALKNEAVNKNLLLLAVIVLLSIGVLRLVAVALSGTSSERVCTVSFDFLSHSVSTEALVDSGNLLKDPLDGTPVMLWKATDAAKHLPAEAIRSSSVSDPRLKSRLRLIPVRAGDHSRILTGYRTDGVTVTVGKKKEKVNLIIAIDEEDGTYGGCFSLLPSAVLDIC